MKAVSSYTSRSEAVTRENQIPTSARLKPHRVKSTEVGTHSLLFSFPQGEVGVVKRGKGRPRERSTPLERSMHFHNSPTVKDKAVPLDEWGIESGRQKESHLGSQTCPREKPHILYFLSHKPPEGATGSSQISQRGRRHCNKEGGQSA